MAKADRKVNKPCLTPLPLRGEVQPEGSAARGVRHGLLTLFLLEVKKRKEESREGVWREERPRSDSIRIGSVWNFGERPEDGGQERLAQRNSGGDGSKRNDDDTQLDQ